MCVDSEGNRLTFASEMSQPESKTFDGHLDALKHFPPSFLTRDFRDTIKALHRQVGRLRVEADAVAATGTDDVRYLEMLKKADAWDTTLALVAEHLKTFKIVAPMYAAIFRKFAAAHEGLYRHLKSRRAFVLKITEREITNQLFEFIVEDFPRYEACLENIHSVFTSEEDQLQKKFEELTKMDMDELGEDLSKAVEELACEARLLFATPSHSTVRLMEELHSLDSQLAESILLQAVEAYPIAADLSKIEESVHFGKLIKQEELAVVE